jgi:hypothetical protein
VYDPKEALIRRYLEFTTNVVKRIKMNGVPEISIEIVKNCAAPANTERDIKVKLKRERPAFLASSPYAMAKEATPKVNGVTAFIPSKNLSALLILGNFLLSRVIFGFDLID